MDLIPTNITIYRPGHEPQDRTVDMMREPGYNRLAEFLTPLLDGAELEHVYVFWNNEPLDMFVDELGAVKPLPRNELATEIYRNNVLSRRPGKDPESLPAIYGPAVLFHRRVWF